MTHDAVVLAGGRGQRIGGDKPAVVVAGRRLLDHALDAVHDARAVVVVGPEGVLGAGAATPGIGVTQEDPPYGGPVAGIAAGLAWLDEHVPLDADRPVLLLACDVPWARRLVPRLLDAWSARTDGTEGVHVEADGRAQWLVGVYSRAALRRAVRGVVGEPGGLRDAPVRRLVGHLALATVDDPDGLSLDVDTWDDVERTARRLEEDSAP
ncbi:molybdenum cofactor guanylyltransferase [Sanguibacter suaedae]|uniref:NTP transferase domain-containing protein n=1 Tax=Sanguibacter suaedae TaxID=2795737 RepID=A0A934I7L6_9MICO|nr:NTP transferase domain-containing protein [Sanguibacter suaedae]MBI9113467.1 NTP transferase domain-containing protein [Sanguibacter suaedae]